MSVHDAIVTKVVTELTAALITNIVTTDKARAGVVFTGPLQGDPDPDAARISVTVHENDPDGFRGMGGFSAHSGGWEDEVEETEIGSGRAVTTWARRFTVNARCLLEDTSETLAQARLIASTVRERIEDCLLGISFTGIGSATEKVVREVASDEMTGEMIQSGGPDAYDYFIKVRFSVLTTKGA